MWILGYYAWCVFLVTFGCMQRSTADVVADQSPANTQSCRSEYTPGSGVHWYSTSYEDYITSDPLCLDEAKFPITRSCTQSGWVPSKAPECKYNQEIRTVHDNFARFSGYDLFVIGENAAVYRSKKKKEWSRECLKFGFTKDIMEYQKYFTMHPEFFWLPIRRHKPHFPHVWSNLGEKFGQVTEEFLNYGDEDCLAMNFSSNIIKSIPCRDRYTELCLYVYVSPLLQLACPKDMYTTRFKRDESKCFQVSSRECRSYFRYTKPYDRIIYKALMSEFKSDGDCRVEIDPFQPNMSFSIDYWKTNIEKVTYVNWSPMVNRQHTSPLATFTLADKEEGNWLLGTNYHCTVCEENMVLRTPSMTLTYNNDKEELELFISHPEFLWTEDPEDLQVTCFTTATHALLANVDVSTDISRYSYTHLDFLVNVAVTEVELKGTGEYWCEAVAYPSFDIISTNRQVFYKKEQRGVVFAIQGTRKCENPCHGIYDENKLKKSSSEMQEWLNKLGLENVKVDDVRVMDIISSSSSGETILFHVTFSVDKLKEELEVLNFGHDSDTDFEKMVNTINYVAKQLEPHINNPKWSNDFFISGFNHTMFCVSEMTEKRQLMWGRMNEIKVIPSLCLNENYVLKYASCVGEFPYGVNWEEDDEIDQGCKDEGEAPPLTKALFNMLVSTEISVEAVREMEDSLQEHDYDFNPADVFLLGSLIGRFARNVTDLIKGRKNLDLFTSLFSQSQRISTESANMGHRYMNATNLILDNFEVLLQRSSLELKLFESEEEEMFGVVEFRTGNTRSFIIDPNVKNITGIAFYLPSSSSEFQEGTVKYLTSDQDEMALLEDPNLEAAAFLPQMLLEEIQVNFTGPLRIVMTVIENPVLFRSVSETNFEPSGRIITASIPNYDRPLPALFPIIYRPRRDYEETDEIECSFWNFHPSNRSAISEWSGTGCDFLAKSTRNEDPAFMCGCQHFTNFAFLMTGQSKNPKDPTMPEVERKILQSLDVITQTGCILSLSGVLLIWLTAVVFRSWREREGTKVLLQLSLAIGLQVLMMLLINFDMGMADAASSCIITGIVLHYTVLAIFAWMLITAYLQYLRYVVVFGNLLPKRFFLKANLVGWIFPMMPCVIICIIDPALYIPASALATQNFENVICYPQGNTLLFGVIIPVCLIMFVNLCIFIMVIYNITTGLQKCNNNRKGSSKIHRAQFRLTILLFFLLGLTWSFALLVHFEYGTYVFTYLFVIFGTMQGFVLFVYFIILDPQTRKLWLNRFSCCTKKELTSSTYNS